MNNYDKQKDKLMRPIIKRPWGEFEEIGRFLLDEQGEKNDVVIKKIIINPKSRFSLQSHSHRSEQWNVLSGEGLIVLGENESRAKAGDYAFVPRGEKHRMSNTSAGDPLIFIEVSEGQFDEDDIIRYADDYGRI